MDAAQLTIRIQQHWAKWLPKRTRRLQQEGTWAAETAACAELAMAEYRTLRMAGFREHEAEEVVLTQFVLLSPKADDWT